MTNAPSLRLSELHASNYRSLRDVTLPVYALNVLIGTNAAGKSNVLDALRFLSEGIRQRDFADAIHYRGGMHHLVWKGGATTSEVSIAAKFSSDAGRTFEWKLHFLRSARGFVVAEESLYEHGTSGAPRAWLQAASGRGWWWSADANKRVQFELHPTACSLTAAAADTSFPGRLVAEHASGWEFFDPITAYLRRASDADEAERLHAEGFNLAARLNAVQTDNKSGYKTILDAMQAILGLPDEITFQVREDGRVFFRMREGKILQDQIGCSSGTLRMLALLAALFGEERATVVGIEEPENNVHPFAVKAFAEYLRYASERVQVIVTTHSRLLLDALNMPEAVCIVRRTAHGTAVQREPNPDGVRQALAESGFGLGEFYESAGFGG